jgi:hypothetical protein
LNPNTAPQQARDDLEDLRQSLRSMPEVEAVTLIRQFLSSGKDRSTGLSFEINPDGSLSEWPTFRTFLLDALLKIDPVAAASIGRDILAQPSSADEWALALRNVARGEPLDQCSDFLREKTEELISNPQWQLYPSIGYLNAFDVLVHIESTSSTTLLSGLIANKDRRDLAHAGFLTLDRLVQRKPVEELSLLANDRPLQQSRPEMVAQQFARADVRDPAQRELMKSWLLDPSRTPDELRSFAGIYPNNNRFVSNNLLTREAAQSGDDLAVHDQVALRTIDSWSQDPSFERVRSYLEVMVSRLEGFVSVRQDHNSPHSPE